MREVRPSRDSVLHQLLNGGLVASDRHRPCGFVKFLSREISSMLKFVVAIACAAVLAPVSALPVKTADNARVPQIISPTSAPSTARWCGFEDKFGSIFRCGYTTLEQCKASVGEGKESYCIPDPKFAENFENGNQPVWTSTTEVLIVRADSLRRRPVSPERELA